MKKLLLIALAFCSLNVFAQTTSEYCEQPADAVTTDHGTCSPLFTWETSIDGDVVITISNSEGDAGETKFRNGGMNGVFKLNDDAAAFTAAFDKAKTSDFTYTLSLKGDAPAAGAVITYAGQIECRSSVHTDDWSDYSFNGYTYGTSCPVVEDTEAPTNVSASATAAYTKVTLTLSADDNVSSLINYTITNTATSESWSTSGAAGSSVSYTISGLALETAYTFSVVAADKVGNQASAVTVNFTTLAGVGTGAQFDGQVSGEATHCWSGTWDGNGDPTFFDFTYTINYTLIWNADATIGVRATIDADEQFMKTPGMVFQIMDFVGGTHYNDFSKSEEVYTAVVAGPFGTAGENVTLRFRFAYNQGDDTEDIQYVVGASSTPTAIENVEAVKVLKTIENGQIVIIKNGVRYNAQGARL